ncbi:MAG: (5-formylfuran-3-yl)methyl phosphate synthase [Chromatiales bacterium]
MTALLVSVRSPFEAEIALAASVDIIDLKEPSAGVLGAVAHEIARAVVSRVNRHVPVSATVGDCRGDPLGVADAVVDMAATGVDIIKVGIFQQSERAAILQALMPLAASGIRVVAVLFVDRTVSLDVADIAQAGLYGVMLDTADKQSGSLTQLLTAKQLYDFPQDCHHDKHRLRCGLAGGLRLEDIPEVTRGSPDYLGFRGALCDGGERDQNLSDKRVAAVRAALKREIVLRAHTPPTGAVAGGYGYGTVA